MHKLLYKLHTINKQDPLKFSLENSSKMSALWGNPEKAFPAVHIAGSNGKGSVAVKIAKGLELSGKTVGLYTSPHISCFRERMRINGEMISEDDLFDLLEEAFKLIEENTISATFFEITTLVALKYFAKSCVDIVVLETGLGGRLDATNIALTSLSVITSISLEHTDILGNCLEAITLEKGGIIKEKVPVVIGPTVIRAVIQEVAAQKNSPIYTVDGEFQNFQAENSAIASKALELLGVDHHIILRAKEALPPCRIEEVDILNKPKVILDVAHNPDGLMHLFKSLMKKFPGKKFCIVFGMSTNKDINSSLRVLKQQASQFYFVQAANERSCKAIDLAVTLKDLEGQEELIHVEESIPQTMDCALNFASLNDHIVVVCGSFFIMSEVRAALGISEERDLIDLNEKKIFPI